MKLKHSLFLALALTTAACGKSPMSPSVPTSDLDYDINIPDRATTLTLQSEFPNGVRMAPIRAQVAFDYRVAYHANNVYYGPGAPPSGTSAGLVSAPVALADEDSFMGSEYPGGLFPANTRMIWVGRFVYTPPTPNLDK